MPFLKTMRLVTMPDETEYEAELSIHYTYHKGHSGCRIDPPEPESVEITKVVTRWLGMTGEPAPEVIAALDALLEGDEELDGELLQAYHEDMIEAAEYRAEARREDRLLEHFVY